MVVAQITMMFNHMVEKQEWLSKDRFVKIMAGMIGGTVYASTRTFAYGS